jgi:hypothetical protein
MVDDDDFDVFGLADRKHQFGAKAQQPILMREYRASDLVGEDVIEQLFPTLFSDSSFLNQGRR